VVEIGVKSLGGRSVPKPKNKYLKVLKINNTFGLKQKKL